MSVSGTGTLVYAGTFLGKNVNRSARACALTSPCGTRIINTWTVSALAYPGLNVGGAGILNLLVIAYALRPRLRSRLTLGGRTFPRNPWDFGEMEFNHLYRYLCLHSHSQALHGRLPFHFVALGTLSYPSVLLRKPWLRYMA